MRRLLLHQSLLDVLRALESRTDRVDSKLLVSVGPVWVVDAAHDARDLEDVLGDLGGHDVAVVAFGNGYEAVSILNSSTTQDVGVGAVPDDLVAPEVVGEDAADRGSRELVGVAVDDDHVVARLVHVRRDLGSDAAAANDEDLQSPLIIGRPRRRSGMALVRMWARALSLHFHGCDGARNWVVGGVLRSRPSWSGRVL